MPNLVLYSRGLRPACAPCRARLPLSACVAQYQHCLAASTPSLARVPRVHEALPRILSASNACRSVRNGARSTRRRGRSPRAPLADSAGYRVLPARPAFAIPARRLHVSAAAHPVPFWLGRFAPSSRLHQWATPRPYELNWPLRAVSDAAAFCLRESISVQAAASVSNRCGIASPRQCKSWTVHKSWACAVGAHGMIRLGIVVPGNRRP